MIAETLSDLKHSPPSCSCSRDIYPLMSKQPIKPTLGRRERGGAYVCLYSPVVSPVFSRSVAKNYERDYSKKLCSNGKKGMTEPLQRHGY